MCFFSSLSAGQSSLLVSGVCFFPAGIGRGVRCTCCHLLVNYEVSYEVEGLVQGMLCGIRAGVMLHSAKLYLVLLQHATMSLVMFKKTNEGIQAKVRR